MLRYNGATIGEVVIEQNFCEEPRRFKIQIRQGNCLAVLVHVRKSTPEEFEETFNGDNNRELHGTDYWIKIF